MKESRLIFGVVIFHITSSDAVTRGFNNDTDLSVNRWVPCYLDLDGMGCGAPWGVLQHCCFVELIGTRGNMVGQ